MKTAFFVKLCWNATEHGGILATAGAPLSVSYQCQFGVLLVATLGNISTSPEISPCSSIILSFPLPLYLAPTYKDKFSIIMICSLIELYEYLLNKINHGERYTFDFLLSFKLFYFNLYLSLGII